MRIEAIRLARRTTLFLVGMAFSAGLAEVVLRQLPVAMGLYRTKQHELWPLYGYGAGQHFNYSVTWQMLFARGGDTNNYGHIAPFDYQRHSRPIVVIGDSFIESQMNPFVDTLQGELGRLFDGRIPVYGFGFGGNSLGEYLALARMTRDEFQPRAMVFLIVHNDVKESWTNRVGHHFFQVDASGIKEAYLPLAQTTPQQRIREILGDSALYRYIQANLAFTIDRVIDKHRPRPEPAGDQQAATDEISRRVIDYFLVKLPERAGLAREKLVLVFDSDRARIYHPSAPPGKSVDSSRTQQYFRSQAKALGYQVIETESIFENHYRQHRRRLDYLPTDAHWNGLGHRIVAAEVHDRLEHELVEGQLLKDGQKDPLKAEGRAAVSGVSRHHAE